MLVSDMAKPQYVTKKMLDEAVDAILGGMNRMFEDIGKRFDGVASKDDIKSLETRTNLIETEIRWIKD